MTEINIKKYNRPLFITAHPDDMEIFAGGIVDLLADKKCFLVIFSEGDKGRWESKYKKMTKLQFEDIRTVEAHWGGKVLGVDYIKTLDFDDRQIYVDNLTVNMLKNEIKRINPDVIFSFEFTRWLNYDPHPDHLAVGNIVKKAVKELKKSHLFDYYVFSTTLPSSRVDITKVRKVKIKAVNKHVSQRKLNKIILPLLETIPCRIVGLVNKTWYAEGYRKISL